VVQGEGPAPSLVLLLIQRLPDDSLTSALASGGRQFFGWGQDRALLTELVDAVNINTRSTGNWKKGKAPDFPPYPRPSRGRNKPASTRGAEDKLPKKFSVAALHKRFTTGGK
jgi:hypothetical protein